MVVSVQANSGDSPPLFVGSRDDADQNGKPSAVDVVHAFKVKDELMNSFGFHLRNEMEETARKFVDGNHEAEAALQDWIATLPWDKKGYLVLTFNW